MQIKFQNTPKTKYKRFFTTRKIITKLYRGFEADLFKKGGREGSVPQQTKNCLFWKDPRPLAVHGLTEPAAPYSPHELSTM